MSGSRSAVRRHEALKFFPETGTVCSSPSVPRTRTVTPQWFALTTKRRSGLCPDLLNGAQNQKSQVIRLGSLTARIRISLQHSSPIRRVATYEDVFSRGFIVLASPLIGVHTSLRNMPSWHLSRSISLVLDDRPLHPIRLALSGSRSAIRWDEHRRCRRLCASNSDTALSLPKTRKPYNG